MSSLAHVLSRIEHFYAQVSSLGNRSTHCGYNLENAMNNAYKTPCTDWPLIIGHEQMPPLPSQLRPSKRRVQ